MSPTPDDIGREHAKKVIEAQRERETSAQVVSDLLLQNWSILTEHVGLFRFASELARLRPIQKRGGCPALLTLLLRIWDGDITNEEHDEDIGILGPLCHRTALPWMISTDFGPQVKVYKRAIHAMYREPVRAMVWNAFPDFVLEVGYGPHGTWSARYEALIQLFCELEVAAGANTLLHCDSHHTTICEIREINGRRYPVQGWDRALTRTEEARVGPLLMRLRERGNAALQKSTPILQYKWANPGG